MNIVRRKFTTIYKTIDSSVDEIHCLGDYFSPYKDYDWEEQKNNFLNILEIAKKDSRVKLYLGNHDTMYFTGDGKSRYDIFHAEEIRNMIKDNSNLFRLVTMGDDYIISHAGVSQVWFDYKFKEHNSPIELNDILKESFEKNDYTKLYRALKFSDCSWDCYGEAEDNSPVWIRPNGLLKSPYEPNKYKYQFVGHTKTAGLNYFLGSFAKEGIAVIDCGIQLICVDTNDEMSYAVFDTESKEVEPFELQRI